MVSYDKGDVIPLEAPDTGLRGLPPAGLASQRAVQIQIDPVIPVIETQPKLMESKMFSLSGQLGSECMKINHEFY